jgi:hypothetical protein
MIGRETRMLLRHYLAQGASKSALARQLGVSRDTVHRWIRAGDLDRDLDTTRVQYGPRRPVPTKLDAYKAIIETRLTIAEPCNDVHNGRGNRPTSVTRRSNQNHTRCFLPARVRQVAKVFVFGQQYACFEAREGEDVFVLGARLDLDNRRYIVPCGAKCSYNRVVAALVGEKTHILVLFPGVSLADKYDFFSSKGVRCVSHRRMEVIAGQPWIRLEQTAFGGTFAELAKQ